MKYEVNDKEITFTVDTDQLGKWAIIEALKQTLGFWKTVRHHATFRRKAFETIIVKINRVDVL